MARTNPRLSRTKIARSTGVSLAHISKIYKGTRNPSVEVAKKLAKVQGISLDAFFKELTEIRRFVAAA